MERKQLLNDPEEAFRIASEGQQSSLWTSLPGIIISVDFSKMTISVQPTIQGSVIDEIGVVTFVKLPVLEDVPICFPRGGGFTMTFPLKPDDEVLVMFASRCIDSWWQSGGIQKPMEARMHDLSDGFAILAPSSQPKVISAISTDGVQIRSDDGATYVDISSGHVITFKALDVNIIGNLHVTGNVVASGEVTAASDSLTPVSLTTHVHPGVTIGGGSTGTGVG